MLGELEYLKIETRLKEFFRSHGLLDWTTLILSGNKTNKLDEMFTSVMGEYVFLK